MCVRHRHPHKFETSYFFSYAKNIIMNRNLFLKIGFAVSTLITAPFALLARQYGKRVDKGFKVDAGKDRFDKSINILEGDTFYTKVSTKDTDGDLYIYESTRIKEGGPALHYHPDIDEWWFILQGEFMIKVGEEIHRAKIGDSVFCPRHVPHTFAKVGEGEGRLIMLFQPAGKMEDFFRALSEGAHLRMSKEEQDKFRRDHGIVRVGPALNYLKGW